METWFVPLTRTGGQEVMVNMAQVVSVKDRAGDKYVVVTTANGVDFEVQEDYDAIVEMVMGSS